MDTTDLNAEEQRFIEIMFPHLLNPDPPVSTPTRPSVSPPTRPPLFSPTRSPTSSPTLPPGSPPRALASDEQRFIEVMFPHLLEPDSPPTSPISPPHQAHLTPGIMRTSSPLNVTQTSLPDWGPPISEDYQDPVPQSPRISPQRRRYSIFSDNERAIPSHYRSQPTMDFSSNTMRQLNIKDSLLRKFDRSLQAEYNMRRKTYSSGPTSAGVQGDNIRGRTMMAIQADNLAKAEALALFSEAVEAAEKAAAAEVLPPEKEREATRAYEARLVEAVSGEAASGGHPIEVVAYIGVTHPKKAIPPRH